MTENTMTDEHVQFIMEKLIPFIMRENGFGFSMETWTTEKWPGAGEKIYCSGEGFRPWPKCGTICCIGGSINHLRGSVHLNQHASLTGEQIGLNDDQSDCLFYGHDINTEPLWPEPFFSRHKDGASELERAKVACELLEEVCRTRGKCLNSKE